jgi:hypothetical protein
MAAAIIAAGKTRRLVIRFLHLDKDKKAKRYWLFFGSGEAIDRLKELSLHVVSTVREVTVRHLKTD